MDAQPSTDEAQASAGDSIDLVGGAWGVLESDPGVFTCLLRNLGVSGCEIHEVRSIEEDLDDRGPVHALILCYPWMQDHHRQDDFTDLDQTNIYFANQLITDACATQAILNVVFNCPQIDVGDRLAGFKEFTQEFSSPMKGLAVTNDPFLRITHNALARPSDIRAANYAAAVDFDPNRPRKKRKRSKDESDEMTYHFIAYVPIDGKVFELDGLKSGPLEVGEIDADETWIDIVRPAIRLKMKNCAVRGDGRFNLLAVGEDQYQRRWDELELLRRVKRALERRLHEAYGPAWQEQVDPELLESTDTIFPDPPISHTFDPSFGSLLMPKQMAILDLPVEDLVPQWNTCIASALPAKILLDEELDKAKAWASENIKRTHDYEPFIKAYISRLSAEGLLNNLLGLDEVGEGQATSETAGVSSRGRGRPRGKGKARGSG
ncbi:hypothetical protein BOTBODRAFT_57534 [Botryobasidium botryosum FD-172 SS1]|uniref:Ubiquitin carboxyl-terminal hydrolase n=1 Tax=Botryobasidium botryosum (strain FD-172 SS1) TaxID=930990 RepID=A0A067MI00_BOTB1|nr:hypothetical protein BOTBODRAFT_57534 [Botryobasidium botryosum FD-172 SS1]